MSKYRVGRLVAVGACCVAIAGCSDATASLKALDLPPQPWHEIAGPALSPRGGSVVVATPTRVFVLGGFDRTKNPGPALFDGASYDPWTGKWTTIAPGPFEPFAATWLRDRLFVAGTNCRSIQGEDEGAGMSEIPCPASQLRAAIYDPDGDRWTELPVPNLGYEIGANPFGDAFTIGAAAVLRLKSRSGQSIGISYEAWSATGGWKTLPAPDGDDFEACQANDAVVSLSSRAPLGFTALDDTLQWSKLATPDATYRNDPPLACTGSEAITWEPFGNAGRAYVFDTAKHAITTLPQRHGGFPNAAVAVRAGDHSVLLWDLDGDVPSTLVYDARASTWLTLPYRVGADVGVSPDGTTFIARQLAGGDVPDTWWQMTLS